MNTSNTDVVENKTQTPASPYQAIRTFFVLAVVAQFGLIAALAATPLATINSGRTITLDTLAVDPWDMFRGDYITLRYRCNTIKKLPGKILPFSKTPYIVLEPDGAKKWQVVDVTDSKPTLSGEQVALRGKVAYRTDDSMEIKYGIEQVFVPEGRGRDAQSGKDITVDIACGANGNAVIKEVRTKEDKLYKWSFW